MIRFSASCARRARRFVELASRVPLVDVAIARLLLGSTGSSGSTVYRQVRGQSIRIVKLCDQAAASLMEVNESGIEHFVRGLDIGSITDVSRLEGLALRFASVERHELALACRRRVVELEPSLPESHVALAASLLKARKDGLVQDPIVGLTAGSVPRVSEARRALEQARQLAPSNAYVLYRLGRLEFTQGDVRRGLALLEKSVELVPRAPWILYLATCYRKPHVARFDEAQRKYEQVLDLDPGNTRAFRGFVIMAGRTTQDWQSVWSRARRYEEGRSRGLRRRRELLEDMAELFCDDVDLDNVRSAIRHMMDLSARGVKLRWATTSLIAFRLQFLGELDLGFALKRVLAERTLRWLGNSSAGHLGHRQKMLQALTYLGRNDEALAAVSPILWETHGPQSEAKLEKLAADVHIVRGDIEPYLRYSKRRRQESPLPGDQAMEGLIQGKRVAVVGPANTGDKLGSVIDEFDVVIRPRFAPQLTAELSELLGSRTDIAYYTGREIGDLITTASNAIANEDLKIVVARSLSYGVLASNDMPWLRFYRHDFSLCFQSVPLAIPRIIYDILQFNPSEISLFNVDFYSGISSTVTDYREKHHSVFGPYSIQNDLILAHDLVFDFRLMKAFMLAANITAHGAAAEVLGWTTERYLMNLEKSPIFK